LFQETIEQVARYCGMPKRKPPPMIIQPLSDGSHMPRQMVSRVEERIGPKQPTPYDKAFCAKSRAEALKLQREALGRSIPKKDPKPAGHQKTS